MLKIKEILSDIVRQTYGADCNPAYFRFYVEITNKNSRTCHGRYTYRNHKIEIFNTYRDDEAIVCTTIHELAHHVDYCNRRKSDHQKEFYAEYEKLLFAALDMGIVNKYKFMETAKDASDSNKIRKIMDRYIPNPVSYKKDAQVISVGNCFEYREELKSMGYKYNGNAKVWEKEVPDADVELEKLGRFSGITVGVSKATELHFEGHEKLVAVGDTYACKAELKKAGFRFVKKQWECELKNPKAEFVIRQTFPMLTFKKI